MNKAVIIKSIGYRCKKKRGIDPGKSVLRYLTEKYNIIVTREGPLTKYTRQLPEGPWRFRTVSGGPRDSDWSHVEDIYDFILEDLNYNPDLWPGFKPKA